MQPLLACAPTVRPLCAPLCTHSSSSATHHCREGHFYVLPEEPVQQQQQQKLDREGQQHEPTTPGVVAGTPAVGSSQALPLRAGELTAAQLDSLRAQLEALLPVTPADSHDSC